MARRKKIKRLMEPSVVREGARYVTEIAELYERASDEQRRADHDTLEFLEKYEELQARHIARKARPLYYKWVRERRDLLVRIYREAKRRGFDVVWQRSKLVPYFCIFARFAEIPENRDLEKELKKLLLRPRDLDHISISKLAIKRLQKHLLRLGLSGSERGIYKFHKVSFERAFGRTPLESKSRKQLIGCMSPLQ